MEALSAKKSMPATWQPTTHWLTLVAHVLRTTELRNVMRQTQPSSDVSIVAPTVTHDAPQFTSTSEKIKKAHPENM